MKRVLLVILFLMSVAAWADDDNGTRFVCDGYNVRHIFLNTELIDINADSQAILLYKNTVKRDGSKIYFWSLVLNSEKAFELKGNQFGYRTVYESVDSRTLSAELLSGHDYWCDGTNLNSFNDQNPEKHYLEPNSIEKAVYDKALEVSKLSSKHKVK